MKKLNGKRKGLSIRFHIFATMLVLTIAMLAVLWVFQSVLSGWVFKFTKEREIERASNLIYENFDSPEISSLISQVSIEYNLCIKVKDAKTLEDVDGKHFLNDCILCKISNSNSLFEQWEENARAYGGEYDVVLPRDHFRDFAYNEDNFEGDVPERGKSENCFVSTRIIKSGEREYMLILNASIEPMHSTTRAIGVILWAASLIFFVVSIIVSIILSRRLSRPIEKITSSAKELAGGDYRVQFEEKGPCELKELAQTLNTTATALDNADVLQKELIANISHDLRTPLTMISGYSEFMRDFPSEVTPENMQIIIDETARLNSLVNDLLDVSKLQSGTQTIKMERISLTKVVSDTVKRYDKLNSHKEYSIRFESTGDEIFIMADETRLLQVVYNLVNNAINYTGEDKTVTIRQDVLDDVVRISVIDTGEGISEKDLPLIWDRYYKIDKVHKRAILGTGLGLSIVKNVLLLHNSRFGVSSETGKGSTFWFEFKIAK